MRDLINITEGLTPSGDPEGVMTVGSITFEQKHGIGSVGDNVNVNYLGFAALMYPIQFSKLAATRNYNDDSSNINGLVKALEEGKPFGSPFFEINMNEDDPSSLAFIRGHEGRTRVEAIRRVYGRVPVLVHCFLGGGMRARHITLDHIRVFRANCQIEKSKTIVQNNCLEIVYHLGSWRTL